MNKPVFLFTILLTIFAATQTQPVDVNDAVVKIEKQRLVKFPDEVDQIHDSSHSSSKKLNSTLNEAQRILREIEKINQALGYVRKHPEHSKLPAMLDSSEYLFPKPVMQPFHQQYHQFSALNGETILVPSIRSVRLGQQYSLPYTNLKSFEFNHPSIRKQNKVKNKTKSHELVFRLKEVLLLASLNTTALQKMSTHFGIPVQLYKNTIEEYINKNAPEEHRVKGYTVFGDVDDFNSETKQKSHGNKVSNKKFNPKYDLFFLPHELVSVEAANNETLEGAPQEKSDHNNPREEKVIGIQRPYKIQTTTMSSSNGGGSSSNVTTQIIRKRIIPKPLREKDPSPGDLIDQQLQISGISSMTSNTNTNTNGNINTNIDNKPSMNNNPTQNTFNLRPGALNIPNPVTQLTRPNNTKNSTTGKVIKNAFQNIFKFPFRQENKPNISSEISGPVPQMLPVYTNQAHQPAQNFYEAVGEQVPQKLSDYHWDDEISNSASEAEDETNTSTEHMEKQIFGLRNNIEQQTQMEAIKQGGIIIQRLKVRKGGIAIAGPGGVATAGSGGTAIVGPGGYALTHPRSLTIAGPGAKVIAIPSNIDLKDALQRTNLHDQSFPREGKLVATGPTVYYSPATSETDES